MGILRKIFGRGKDEEIDIDSDEFRKNNMHNLEQIRYDMGRDKRIDEERYNRSHRPNKYTIDYLSPTDYGWKLIRERTILTKNLNGKPYKFVALHLSEYDNSCYTCLECKHRFRGILYRAFKPVIKGYFCPICFKKFPNYKEPLTESQKKMLEGALIKSKMVENSLTPDRGPVE